MSLLWHEMYVMTGVVQQWNSTIVTPWLDAFIHETSSLTLLQIIRNDQPGGWFNINNLQKTMFKIVHKFGKSEATLLNNLIGIRENFP